ncbi:protein CTLA-2-alpha [Leptinotarsa decemlineata]|uniref:protein CTLA-2-alpha n=1 Tax=Leptinotarsa decemlineata TaxID=7539 RepID=UPI000C25252C|nr:cathepsin L-like proteinase [Leptinotarsa decemlineata]
MLIPYYQVIFESSVEHPIHCHIISTKMHIKLIVFCVVAIAFAHAVSDGEWNSYKQKFNKHYNTPQDDALHRSIYEKNVQEINAHNQRYKAGQESWEKGVNQFTDMTEEESKRSRGFGPIN